MDEVNLENLNCHYNWNLIDVDLTQEKCDNLLEYLETDSLMNPDVEIPALLFISFLCDQVKRNDQVALETIDEAIKKSKKYENETHAIGYKYLALSNKIHLLVKNLGSEKREILLLLQEIDNFNLCSSSMASIYGTRAFSLGVLGKNKYLEGLSFYQKAFRLDRNYFAWPLGIAILAGRLRRIYEGAYTYPTEIEEECLELSIRLSENNKALPMVFMADLYLIKGRKLPHQDKNDHWLNLAEKFYLYATVIAPECSPVLKRCGKAFFLMNKLELAEKCLLKGFEVNPVDSVCLHRLGQFYDFKKHDWSKAKEFYERAINVRCSRNLFAEMDLARVKKELDPRYDLLGCFRNMKSLYEDDQQCIAKIDAAILNQIEYEAKAKAKKQQQFKRNKKQLHSKIRQSNLKN